jgi:hypothetical protein
MTDWKTKREKKLLVISATQLDTFLTLCKRKWWLNHVRGLPEPSTGSQVFGTVLHAVCERFYLADALGRGPDGKEIELYPAGWHVAPPKYGNPSEGEVGLSEQDQIKSLVAAAISSGVLQRRPDLIPEYEFRRQFINREVDGCRVDLMGVIDVLLPDGIEDHKTTKNMRYAKSPEALRKNIQMIVYAAEVLCVRSELGLPEIERITLRHNVFCKNPDKPEVRKTEAAITVKEVKAHSAEMLQAAKEMISLRKTANAWHECPQPIDIHACNAYGGCAYQRICCGEESEENYEKRLASQTVNRYSPNVGTDSNHPSTGKETGMTTFAELLAKKKAQNAGQAPAAAPAPPPPAQEPAPAVAAPAPAPVAAAVPAADGTTPPPWAIPSCGACKGLGFNTQGNPCRICDIKSKASGMASENFVMEGDGSGNVIWSHKTNPELVGISPKGAVAPPAPKTTERTTKPAAEAPAAPAAVPAPVPTEEPVKGPGRPKKGFILCINCTPCSGEGRPGSGRGIHRLDKYLLEAQAKLAADGKVGSFFELDAFKRRDALASMVPVMADEFGADIVVATGYRAGTEMAILVDGLRPLAGREIIAAL